MSNLVINANSIYDRVIRIGRQTENLVSSITFNLNMWIDEYGAGECVLNVRRNGDGSAYPVPMTITDGKATWTITDTDTSKKGRGEIQLVYHAGDKVKTSPIFTISCGESLVGGEVPEPYEDWLAELGEMTAQVEAAKTSADQSAQTAQTAANTATTKAIEAEQSANTASGFANNASASAQSASESAQAASQSAEQAASSVADVEASAQAASQSAQSAESAKQAAQTAESNAQGFAQTASEKASQAAESAANAAESVTDAQAEVTRASAEADRARAEAEQAASRIYDFLPTETASGSVASFADGADNVPLKSLVVEINPVQSGEGDQSPANVRPISGWTGMTVNANGTEIPISWESEAGTIYGGSLDVLTGVLTVDKAVITATEFYSYASGDLTYGRVVLPNALPTVSVATDYITSKFPVDKSAAENTTRRVSGYAYFYFPAGTTREYAESVVNGTQIVYPIADPATYQLTPHEVKSLLGQNNIYSDTGDTTVEYRADTSAYIAKKIAEAISALS